MAEPQLNAETRPSGLRWVMVGLIFLATVINYLCRQAYSVSATTLQQVFSLSNEDYGLLTSGFFFAYAISNGVSGPIIDRLGRQARLPSLHVPVEHRRRTDRRGPKCLDARRLSDAAGAGRGG